MKINISLSHIKFLQKNILLLTFALFFLLPFIGLNRLAAQENLKLLISAPTVLTSDATGGTISTETFESFSSLPNNIWAPQPAGYSSTIGTYTQTGGDSYVKFDDQYGTGSPKYMSIKVGGKVNLAFDTPQNYFGFAWPAGDGQNTIKIVRQGQVLGTFTTDDVIALLPKNNTHQITAINGSQYFTKCQVSQGCL